MRDANDMADDDTLYRYHVFDRPAGAFANFAPLCTRAELWAAIERLAAASYGLGVDDGMDETETINSIESADAWLALRALLGMEPE